MGGQGGLVSTKTKHLLNRIWGRERKNLRYLEFLFLIGIFQKLRQKKSSHRGSLQQLSGLKCAHFDPFVSTHSSWGQGGIYTTVFELQANIMATSKHRATTSMLVILPSPERICSSIRQGMGRGWNGRHCGATSVKKHDRFLKSEFLQRGKLHRKSLENQSS